jgi:hypothetical protein
VACLFLIIGAFLGVMMSRYAKAGVSPKLIKYVNNALEVEMSIPDIREEMQKSGWTDEEIDLAVKKARGSLA